MKAHRFHALLLAAGAATRFGGRKLLAPWRGQILVQAAARAALAAPVEEVVAVVGCDGREMEGALTALQEQRLRTVHAPHWRDGISASLRAGVEALPPDSNGVVIFLGDMPAIPKHLAGELLAAIAAGLPAAEVRVMDRPGHPVAFAQSLYPALRALAGDRGARSILSEFPNRKILRTDDAGASYDVDTAFDLR